MFGKRLLLVEDDIEYRIVMAEALSDEGFDVHEADDGAAAIDILERLLRLDILVTDLQLPGGLDGNAVAHEAKRIHPLLPVLYISGNPAALTNPIGPIDAFVAKPFTSRRLSIEITRLLASANPLGTTYRFYCRNGTHRVAKWQKMTLHCDSDALAHAAELLQEGFLNVEVVDGVRPVGLLQAH
jgi:CheY-like chemotaxis protein